MVMPQNGEKDLEFIEALQRTGLQRFPVHWLHRQIKLFYGINQDRSVAGRLKGLADRRLLEFDGGAFIFSRNSDVLTALPAPDGACPRAPSPELHRPAPVGVVVNG